MKETYFLILVMIFIALQMKAQDKGLKEYEGTYTFADQSLVAFADIVIANDKTLNISATVGSSDLQYVNEDKFSLPQYGGTINFVRNADNTVSGFKISIPMVGVENLEAIKENGSKDVAEEKQK